MRGGGGTMSIAAARLHLLRAAQRLPKRRAAVGTAVGTAGRTFATGVKIIKRIGMSGGTSPNKHSRRSAAEGKLHANTETLPSTLRRQPAGQIGIFSLTLTLSFTVASYLSRRRR